jgi:drug/metabolite transporter (DMT)-like permease
MKNEAFVLGQGDIYLLLCAFCYSIQILLVDYFVQRTDPIKLSALQFLFCGIFSGIGMLATEVPSWSNILGSAIPLLYAGAISTGIGFTFQVIGQKHVPATIASLIMSLESVIAGLAGWVLLHEMLSRKELLGCGLVFVAIIITQLPLDKMKPRTKQIK